MKKKYALLAVEARGFFGWLIYWIRFLTYKLTLKKGKNYRYTHAAVLNIHDNIIYEQDFRGPLMCKEILYKWKYKIVKVYDIDYLHFNNLLREMVGVEYDWKATIGFYLNLVIGILPRRFHKYKLESKNKYNCVEFAGKLLELPELTYKVAPDEMFDIIS